MENFYFEMPRDLEEYFTVSDPNPYNTIELHCHRQFEILYVQEGENEMTVNGVTRILKSGQFAFADSFDLHSMKSRDGCMSTSIIFPYYVLTEFLDIRASQRFSENFITDERAHQFVPIFELMQTYKTKQDYLMTALAKTFLGLLLRCVPLHNAEKKRSDLSYKILNYIEQNFKSDISLESTAYQFGYTKYHFSKLFHAFFHCNFNTYLNTIRARHAHKLIYEKKYNVLNAAFDSGFNSMPTFYRVYKKLYPLRSQDFSSIETKN